MEFNFEKGTFLHISFKDGKTALSIFKDINEHNEVVTYADYFVESERLFYDSKFNILCNIKSIKNVTPCLGIEIAFLKEQLLKKRIIFNNNELYILKHEDYTVVRLVDLIAIYGGENGYYYCIDLGTNEKIVDIPFDFIQTFEPVTKDELLNILPVIESLCPIIYPKIKEKYYLIKKENNHIKMDPEFLKILKDNLDKQMVAVHKNLLDEEDVIADTEDIPVMNQPVDFDIEYVHRIANRFFKDDELNYHPRYIKTYCLGDIIHVRNSETEEWVTKFFACEDKTSSGEVVIKTTDGRSWKLYK